MPRVACVCVCVWQRALTQSVCAGSVESLEISKNDLGVGKGGRKM